MVSLIILARREDLTIMQLHGGPAIELYGSMQDLSPSPSGSKTVGSEHALIEASDQCEAILRSSDVTAICGAT